MRQHLEVEAKFSVSESTEIPDLAAIAGIQRITHAEVHNLSAVYFDTPDLRLTRSRITLRRRTGGNDAGWHIKFPGAVGRREVQVPLDAPGADENTAPQEILGQVRALIQGRELIPIAQVDNERHMSYLANAEGLIIAEFCDDHVSTNSSLPGGARKQWREWEFELTAAVHDDKSGMTLLQSATSVLTAAGAFVSDSPSKLVSALGESINNVPALPQMAELPKDDPARAILAAIHTNATKIAEYDPKVRADEYDSVHQMRVATRELRSHMQTFEGILGGDEYLQIERELKVLANILGHARDAEVIEERLSNLIDTEVGDAIDEETQDELLTDLGREYQRELSRVISALDSDRYTNLLQSLENLLVNPPIVKSQTPEAVKEAHSAASDASLEDLAAEADLPPTENLETTDTTVTPADIERQENSSYEESPELQELKESAKPQAVQPVVAENVDATKVLLEHLDKAHAKVIKQHKKAVKQWDNLAIPIAEREENFHDVRKAIKKLRYSAEAVGDATEVKTKKLYRVCSNLQSVLGDFQDAVTSRDELLRRAHLAHRKGSNTFAYGVLYQHEQSLSRKYLEGYKDAYKAVTEAYKKLEEDTKEAQHKATKRKKKK